MTAATLRTRPARVTDLPEIVSIHRESFPKFFLTFLGPRFLRLFYAQILGNSQGLCWVAEDENGEQLIGFVAGVTQQAGFYRDMLRRRKWSFAFSAIPALLRSPAIAFRLLAALRKPADAAEAGAEACLMSIAVRSAEARRGIGSRLVQAFADDLKRRGIDRFCLTTDRDGNDRVKAFYEKEGFELWRTFVTPQGRWMNEYLLTLRRG